MSKKVEVRGRAESKYGKVTAWMRKVQVYTKTQIVDQFTKLGDNETAAVSSAVVMLSPRLESKRGDCRGNLSNPWGATHYNEKLAKVAGEERKFRFRQRKVALEVRKRTEKIEVSPAKATKAPAKVTEPVKA